jgi:hypothetical protein
MKFLEKEIPVVAKTAKVRLMVPGQSGNAAFKANVASPVKAAAAGGCLCHFSF